MELFFLLSAFTLFRSSKMKYAEESSPRRNFYIRRAFRILPLWWLIVTLYVAWQGRSVSESLPSYLLYFGFIRYQPGTDVFPLGWTIFVEETFYLMLPIVFGFVQNVRRAALFFVVMWVIHKLWRSIAISSGVPNTNGFIDLFPFEHWPTLALGIVLYWIYSDGVTYRKLQGRRYAWVLDSVAVLLLLLTLGGTRTNASFGLAVMILAALSEHTVIGRLCRSACLRYFGVSCYSIYLLHFLVLDLSDGLKESTFSFLGVDQSPVEVKLLVWLPAVALLCLALCSAVFRGIEKPFVGLGKRLIRRLEDNQVKVLPQSEPVA